MALELRDVFKIFRDDGVETVALRGAWLAVRPGEFVAILGPSGSGKSTLLGLAAGLDAPSAGQVLVAGAPLAALDESQRAHLRRTRVGLVFQRDNLIPFLSARENVELAMGATPNRRQRAVALLRQVGLADRVDHRPAQLSGGESQRVAIAVALANDPVLLLADEPTGELDSASAEAVAELLLQLNRQRHVAIVVVTHNLALARRAERRERLSDGVLRPFDPVRQRGISAPPMARRAASPAAPYLQAVDVAKTYSGIVHALQDVSLAVAPGEVLAIMGPSGCGKSTLLHILGALARPTAGEVWVGGQALGELDRSALATLRRRAIGFVFQAHNLIATLSTAENVALPLILDGVPVATWRPRAHALLEAVGLADAAEKRPEQLSGGQRQRAAIARALAHRPSLLLADEPTGSLDSEAATSVIELLTGVAREDGRGPAVVIVTHDPRIATHCDRVVHLLDGRLATRAQAA